MVHRRIPGSSLDKHWVHGDIYENANYSAGRNPARASLPGEEPAKDTIQYHEKAAWNIDCDVRLLASRDIGSVRGKIDKRERGKHERHQNRNREDGKPHSLCKRTHRIAPLSRAVQLRDIDRRIADSRGDEADEHDGDHCSRKRRLKRGTATLGKEKAIPNAVRRVDKLHKGKRQNDLKRLLEATSHLDLAFAEHGDIISFTERRKGQDSRYQVPTVKPNKKVILIDCGAIVDPKPQNLVQYAQMGTAYAKFFNVENPVVALLSNGTEDKKGNALNKEAFELLKNSNVNFAGNIEAREILSGDYDVIVADGFSGNIALKACEGTAVTMFDLIKKGIMGGGLRAKIGYLLLKPVFKEIKHTMDYNDNGGAVLLGLEKIVVKGHGASKAKAVRNAVLQARELAIGNLVEKISGEISHD